MAPQYLVNQLVNATWRGFIVFLGIDFRPLPACAPARLATRLNLTNLNQASPFGERSFISADKIFSIKVPEVVNVT